MNKRFEVDGELDGDIYDKIETYELHTIHDNYDKSFYFIADSVDNVEHLCKKLNDRENDIMTLQKIYGNLWDENHRLRLTLLHQQDLRNDIKWLKENIGGIEEYDSF